MRLKVEASSSSGNCYLLYNNSEKLIIEAGVSVKSINELVDFDYTNVSGCLISHRHKDHCRAAKNIDQLCTIYTLPDVIEDNNLVFAKEIKAFKNYAIGGFEVIPFESKHDVPCLGFMIKHKDMGVLVFITDSAESNYEFESVNHLLIECNYSDYSISKAIREGKTPEFLRKRIEDTHMEMQTTIKVIENNASPNLRNVVLLHLSSNNASPKLMKKEITKRTGIIPNIASNGLEIDIGIDPY